MNKNRFQSKHSQEEYDTLIMHHNLRTAKLLAPALSFCCFCIIMNSYEQKQFSELVEPKSGVILMLGQPVKHWEHKRLYYVSTHLQDGSNENV